MVTQRFYPISQLPSAVAKAKYANTSHLLARQRARAGLPGVGEQRVPSAALAATLLGESRAGPGPRQSSVQGAVGSSTPSQPSPRAAAHCSSRHSELNTIVRNSALSRYESLPVGTGSRGTAGAPGGVPPSAAGRQETDPPAHLDSFPAAGSGTGGPGGPGAPPRLAGLARAQQQRQ